jgi:hypothetical protein
MAKRKNALQLAAQAAPGAVKVPISVRQQLNGDRNLPRFNEILIELEKARVASCSLAARPVTAEKMVPQKVEKKWDVFISHASEDKDYVDPLAKVLEEANISVWYDRLVLEWGDDLRPMIDSGLVNCRYGIVVLSKAFLGKKKWTEHELNGLFAREQVGKKLVLPIWHGITRDDLVQYSPTLADRLAKISDNDSYESIVNSLLGILGGTGLEHKVKYHARPAATVKAPAPRPILSPSKVMTISQLTEDLSPKEIELLWTAAKDREGTILHSQTFDGEAIRTNARQFLKDADARTEAEWLGALRRLEGRGFIYPLNSERSLYKVTDTGYEAADQHGEFARWNAGAIVLRAQYIGAPSEEHRLSCKGIVAIPTRYFDDQVGADGTVTRSVREPRSLLVEGIDPSPLGSWTPHEVEFVNPVTGGIERFRINGMQYLPPAYLKLPLAG